MGATAGVIAGYNQNKIKDIEKEIKDIKKEITNIKLEIDDILNYLNKNSYEE